MSSKDSFSSTVHYVYSVTTASVDQCMKSKTTTFQNLSQIEARNPLNYSILEEEEEDNPDDVQNSADNMKEYTSIKKEIKQIKEEIKNFNEQIDNLNDQISSLEAANEFFEKHTATFYANDSDYINRQNRRSKKIVHKQKQLQDLTDELKNLEECYSPNAIFFLKEAVKKEKNECNKVKEKISKNFEKIKKAEKKLQDEKRNPVYEAIKEQMSTINDLEESISSQIKEGNRLKREFCQLEILDREDENEIQDLLVKLTEAQYKQEKRQRQYLHLLRKQDQEKEDFKCEPTRYVSLQDDDTARRLFVGIFPQRDLGTQIENAFSSFGEIEFTRVISLNSRPQKYFSQIQYYNHEDALKAITKLNHTVINGITLNIQWASDQPKTQSEKRKTKKSSNGNSNKRSLPPKSSMNLRPITSRLIHPRQSKMTAEQTNESSKK